MPSSLVVAVCKMAGMCSFSCCVLLFVSSVRGIDYSHTESLDGTAYKAHWKFDNETETFYFKVEVNTTGWVGFGVSRLLLPQIEGLQWNRNSMDHYDVIVGGVDDNGTKYYKVSIRDGVWFDSALWYGNKLRMMHMCKYVCLYVLFSHKCRVNNVG